jgi:hypothetical protein
MAALARRTACRTASGLTRAGSKVMVTSLALGSKVIRPMPGSWLTSRVTYSIQPFQKAAGTTSVTRAVSP